MKVKLYNPSKPIKWGFNVKVLCNSESKFAYYIKPWDVEKQYLKDTILSLVKGIEMKNCHLFCDNFYTSYSLLCDPLDVGIYYTGTLRRRRGRPKIFSVKKELSKKEIIPFSKENVNCFFFNDNVIVLKCEDA